MTKESKVQVNFGTDDGFIVCCRNVKGRNRREYLQNAIDSLSPQQVDFLMIEDLQNIFDKSFNKEDYDIEMEANGLWYEIIES